MPRIAVLLTAVLATTLLGACDQVTGALGIESPEKVAAARDADGKAIGSACRHAGRAIEDCYALNKTADKAAIFTGWRDMNDYMRENKIEAVAPQFTPTNPAQLADADAKAASDSEGGKADEAPPAAKSRDGAKPAHGKAHDG